MNTRFSNFHCITQVLKAHRVQALSLNQVLGDVKNLFSRIVGGFIHYGFSLPIGRLIVNAVFGGKVKSGESSENSWPEELRTRMILFVDFFQPGLINMSIDLSRSNTGVTKHFLNLP